ncbi:MAG: hypothetical protein KJ044_11640, partial [Planctomycetes bacterium]|nr:hypothetical protein [Planctomycetota bacterium]
MFELSRLHHARPPAEPDPQRHDPVTPRQYARLAALRRLLALPVALLRRRPNRRAVGLLTSAETCKAACATTLARGPR